MKKFVLCAAVVFLLLTVSACAKQDDPPLPTQPELEETQETEPVPVILEVEPAIDIEIYPEMLDREGNPYILDLTMRVPRVKGNIPNGDKIDEFIDIGAYEDTAMDIEQGNLSLWAENYVAKCQWDYQLHQFHNVYALVLSSSVWGYDWGGSIDYQCIYYDGEIGDVISASEYAEKCGLKPERVLELYNAEGAMYQVETFEETEFYVDDQGVLHTVQSYSV